MRRKLGILRANFLAVLYFYGWKPRCKAPRALCYKSLLAVRLELSRQFSSMSIYYLILAFLFTGSLCSDVEFSVETDYRQETRCSAVQQNLESEWSHAVEQTLTVFIFTQYTDPFSSQISDFISEAHLLSLS